jgi:hypothetical protein
LTKNLFPKVLKARKNKIKPQVDLVSDEGLLPGSYMAMFLLCPHMEVVKEMSNISLLLKQLA